MAEQPVAAEYDDDPGSLPLMVEGTGNAQVDAVVASLEPLDELAVSEHVAVFERAHESFGRCSPAHHRTDRAASAAAARCRAGAPRPGPLA